MLILKSPARGALVSLASNYQKIFSSPEQQAKREKEARKNQKTMSLKEIRISPSIDTHDFQTKVNHTVKFLQSGEKVKITVRFRGREINHSSLGAELLDRFKDSVSEYGSSDKPPQLEGKNMSIIVTPK